MMSAPDGLRLVIERTFVTDPETVFACWTDSRHMAHWFTPTDEYWNPILDIDLRVGGRYRIGMQKGDDGETHIVSGTYREVLPPSKLVFTWEWETELQPPVETTVTVDFRERGDGTRLLLTHERLPDAKTRVEHDEGWSGCFDRLARLAETMEGG